MFLGGRLIRPGMWVVYKRKRGILHQPVLEIRDPDTRVITGRDPNRVEFVVVRDDRTTEVSVVIAADEFFKHARLAKLKEIPQKSRPSKEHGAKLGYK